MTIKYLHQDSSEGGSDDKPLLRNWCKSETKAGREPYEQPLTVRGLKESRSGEWLVAELNECTALIPAKSDLGKNLLDLMPQLKGEGNRLVVIPHKKGKLGFSVGVDDSIKVHYRWNSEEEYLWCSGRDTPPIPETPSISLESIMNPTSPHTSGTGAKVKGKLKTSSNNDDSGEKTALEDA
jgi:hypothetical protein